jgi:hypothetical protein
MNIRVSPKAVSGTAALGKTMGHLRLSAFLAACCPMGLPLPVVHRENLSVTGVGRLLTYFVEKLDDSPAVLARLRAPVASGSSCLRRSTV